MTSRPRGLDRTRQSRHTTATGTTDYESEYTERTQRTQMSNGNRTRREYTSNDTSAEVTPREKILTTPPCGQQMFEFLLLFDRASGSPKVNYFMIDPFVPSRIFPKMNTLVFHKIHSLVGYKPIVFNNCLYLIGGKDWNNGTYMSGVCKFDPRINTWEMCKAMSVARCRFTAESLDGYLYVMGGETRGCRVTDSVERYDPLSDTWTQMKPLPKPRADHASCVLTGMLYISGGISNVKHQCSNIFWSFDPEEGIWREVWDGKTFLPHEREKHAMVPVGKSKILFLSGRGFDSESFAEKDEGGMCHYNTDGVEPEKAIGGLKPMWDLEHPNMSHPRSNAAIVILGRNVWAIGGLSYNKGQSVKMVSYYDIKRRRWREAFPLPEGHFSNIDGILLQIPVTNKDFCFVDRFIYDRWIMW